LNLNILRGRTVINPDPDDDYLRALEAVVRATGAWHDAIIMGRFDAIPTMHNRALTAMTAFIHKYPRAYVKIKKGTTGS
jgi:hypothetical protein